MLMGVERWSVVATDMIGTEQRYILHFEDTPLVRTPRFETTSEPMTEAELRLQLRELGASEDEAGAAIANAKSDLERTRNP
jgi:hypothetical protein